MSYSLSDFKTQRILDTPAKKSLWYMVIERNFGGIECAKNAYETHIKTGRWKSHPITGMCSYIDELTGGDYGTCNSGLQRVAGTLATQFKVRFPEIMYLMTGKPSTTLDEVFFISSSNSNVNKGKKVETFLIEEVDKAKVYSILSDIHSKKLNKEEMKFLSKNLIV